MPFTVIGVYPRRADRDYSPDHRLWQPPTSWIQYGGNVLPTELTRKAVAPETEAPRSQHCLQSVELSAASIVSYSRHLHGVRLWENLLLYVGD
jgi:hypothetical protein